VAGRERERGECQTRLVYVWRETGAFRSARPSRGRAAPTRRRTQWLEAAQPTLLLGGDLNRSLVRSGECAAQLAGV